jgi:hypothetical protein
MSNKRASPASDQPIVPRSFWPRGRYNGKRIVGASIKFKFSIQWFQWRPRWIVYANCLRWMWFYLWIEWEYE